MTELITSRSQMELIDEDMVEILVQTYKQPKYLRLCPSRIFALKEQHIEHLKLLTLGSSNRDTIEIWKYINELRASTNITIYTSIGPLEIIPGEGDENTFITEHGTEIKVTRIPNEDPLKGVCIATSLHKGEL